MPSDFHAGIQITDFSTNIADLDMHINEEIINR